MDGGLHAGDPPGRLGTAFHRKQVRLTVQYQRASGGYSPWHEVPCGQEPEVMLMLASFSLALRSTEGYSQSPTAS